MTDSIKMEVIVAEEAGYKSALKGLALNKKQVKDMYEVALKLSKMDGGHNKFLESMLLWIEVRAPRYWWQEADTYRLSTKQSESTMHTLVEEIESQTLDEMCFEKGSLVPNQLNTLKEAMLLEDNVQKLVTVKRILPEGFIQKRMWCMSYKTLRNVIKQRKNHRLPHWKRFISQVSEQVQYPEFLSFE